MGVPIPCVVVTSSALSSVSSSPGCCGTTACDLRCATTDTTDTAAAATGQGVVQRQRLAARHALSGRELAHVGAQSSVGDAHVQAAEPNDGEPSHHSRNDGDGAEHPGGLGGFRNLLSAAHRVIAGRRERVSRVVARDKAMARDNGTRQWQWQVVNPV